MANSQAKFDYTAEQYATFPQWLRRQLFEYPPPIENADLTGKTAILTGGNQGIGFEIAKQLVALNISKLIIGVRDEAKGKAAADQLKASYKNKTVTIEVWKLDMLEYSTITSFAARAGQLVDLDIVILNAGIYRLAMRINPSTGHEEDIQTNYLSTFLLLFLLLPVLKAKRRPHMPPGRLSIVTSDVAGMTPFPESAADPLLAALDDTSNSLYKWDPQERYGTSKLLGQLLLGEVARRVPSSVAIINGAQPGLCKGSSLARDADSVIMKLGIAVYFGIFGRKLSTGAQVVLDAVLNQGGDSHGEVVDGGKIRP